MNGATLSKVLAGATVLVLLLAFATPAAAQEEKFYYNRNIAEQYTTESAMIISSVVTSEGSDWIIFALDTVGDEEKGLGVGALYGHGSGANEKDSASGSFIAPMGIIEFKDDGDGKYDLRGDDVVSLLPLNADLEDHSGFYEQTQESDETMTWHPRPGYKPVEHDTVYGPSKSESITIAAETEDDVFKLVMHISNSIVWNDDVVLSPYEVKMDFIIEDYPFVEDGTVLALVSIIATANAKWHNGLPTEYVEEWYTSVEEGGWAFDIEGGAGYFSWLTNSTVDGIDTPVVESTLFQFTAFNWTDEGVSRVDLKYVAFTYGRGESIIHDPKLGYVFTDGLPPVFEKLLRGSLGIFLLSVLIFGAVVYGGRWARSRSATPKLVAGRGGSPPPMTPPQSPPQPAAPHVPSVPPQAPPRMPPQGPPAAPPQAAPSPGGMPPRAPPQGWMPPQAPPQGGAPPTIPPGAPPGGAYQGRPPVQGDPRYGYRPPGQ